MFRSVAPHIKIGYRRENRPRAVDSTHRHLAGPGERTVPMPGGDVNFRLVSGAETDRSLRGLPGRSVRNRASSSSTNGMKDRQFSLASRPASSGERSPASSFRYAVNAVNARPLVTDPSSSLDITAASDRSSQQDADSMGVTPSQNRCRTGRTVDVLPQVKTIVGTE